LRSGPDGGNFFEHMFESTVSDPSARAAFDGPLPLLVTTPDASLDVRATVANLLAAQPGPDVLAIASQLDPRMLDQDARLDMVKVFEGCKAWVDAQQTRPLAALIDVPTVEEKEDIDLEVGLAMRWSAYASTDRLVVADELERRLPNAWAAMAAGQLPYEKARELARATSKVTDAVAVSKVEAAVLENASDQTRAAFRESVHEAILAVDPEGAEARRQSARKGRRVEKYPEADGMAVLRALAPADQIMLIFAALTHGAEILKATGQVENLDQGRADTLLSWALAYLGSLHVPERDGLPVAASVVVAASTLAGDDDHPAHLDGYGPITAQAARDLLAGLPPRPGPFGPHEESEGWFERQRAKDFDDPPPDPYDDDPPPPDDPYDDGPPSDGPPDGRPPDGGPVSGKSSPTPPAIHYRLLPVDPDTGYLVPAPGEKLDFGTRRLAPQSLARHDKARHRTCVFPTCRIASKRAQIDHFLEHAKGGRTDSDNTGPCCEHHNKTTKNRPGWEIEPLGGGRAILHTPLGRSYPIEPHRYWLGETDPRGAD
jgi:uncharacterized protein DUF222